MSNFTEEAANRCKKFIDNPVFKADLIKYMTAYCSGRKVVDMRPDELVGLMNEIVIPWEKGAKAVVDLCYYPKGASEGALFARCVLVDGKPDLSTVTPI